MLLNKFYKLNKRKLLVEDIITVQMLANLFMTITIIIMVMIVTTMNIEVMEGEDAVCWFLVAGDTPKCTRLIYILAP